MKALKGRKIIAQGKRNEMSAALGLRPTKHFFAHRMGDLSRLGNGERSSAEPNARSGPSEWGMSESTWPEADEG
jgi:hypothetical protein